MIFIAVVLAVFGILNLYLIQGSLPTTQIFSLGIGLMLYMFFKRIPFYTYGTVWKFIYIVSIILLLVPFFFPSVRGSHRWILIFGFTIQPSEIVKPFFILSLAALAATFNRFKIKEFIIFNATALLPILLIFKQPDLGNAIVYFVSWYGILLYTSFRWYYIFSPALLFLIMTPFSWKFLEPYQRYRIISFLNPEFDTRGVGYNAFQSLITVGSGGFWGKGLREGLQTELKFLPEYKTDFIFAASIERIGFIGGFILLCLYFMFLVKLYGYIVKAQSATITYFVYGIFFMLLSQIIINIGMNIGILPITGITLPFLSMGGSSLIALFISIGIIRSTANRPKEEIALR